MKWLALLILSVEAMAADLQPGLLAKATDGELTVHFTAPTPTLAVEGKESAHPLLKPSFNLDWDGFLLVDRAGEYKISGAPSILIDGNECAGMKVRLPSGERRLQLKLARKQSEIVSLRLEWESEFFPKQPIPVRAFAHGRQPRELRENQSRDFGRELFETLGCGSCHGGAPMRYPFGAGVPHATSSLPMGSLQLTQGCLSERPAPPARDFALRAEEREALQLFVQNPDISEAPASDLRRMSRRFGCVSCHGGREFEMDAGQFEAAVKNHRGAELLFPAGAGREAPAEMARLFRRLRGE